MPTYEYLCNACHEEFETEQRMSDPPHAPCPVCGSSETKRLISHSSFVLKGSGWYVTDYARKGGSSSSGGGSSSSKHSSASPTPSPAPAPAPTSTASAKNSD